MSAVTTHVLDTSAGRPAAGVHVRLEQVPAGGGPASTLGEGVTDPDGRLRELGPERLAAGTYRLVFATGAWFEEAGLTGFWPEVVVTFAVGSTGDHHHVPLLLSPYGYSTYRGS